MLHSLIHNFCFMIGYVYYFYTNSYIFMCVVGKEIKKIDTSFISIHFFQNVHKYIKFLIMTLRSRYYRLEITYPQAYMKGMKGKQIATSLTIAELALGFCVMYGRTFLWILDYMPSLYVYMRWRSSCRCLYMINDIMKCN